MSETYRYTEERILASLPKRKERSNKGTYGKVLCVAGSRNMAGAAYLCAWAAYRTGAGLVRILTPKENRVILQTLLPEALLTTFDPDHFEVESIWEAFDWADVAAVGPGLGKRSWARELTKAADPIFQTACFRRRRAESSGFAHGMADSQGRTADCNASSGGIRKADRTEYPGSHSRYPRAGSPFCAKTQMHLCAERRAHGNQ